MDQPIPAGTSRPETLVEIGERIAAATIEAKRRLIPPHVVTLAVMQAADLLTPGHAEHLPFAELMNQLGELVMESATFTERNPGAVPSIEDGHDLRRVAALALAALALVDRQIRLDHAPARAGAASPDQPAA